MNAFMRLGIAACVAAGAGLAARAEAPSGEKIRQAVKERQEKIAAVEKEVQQAFADFEASPACRQVQQFKGQFREKADALALRMTAEPDQAAELQRQAAALMEEYDGKIQALAGSTEALKKLDGCFERLGQVEREFAEAKGELGRQCRLCDRIALGRDRLADRQARQKKLEATLADLKGKGGSSEAEDREMLAKAEALLAAAAQEIAALQAALADDAKAAAQATGVSDESGAIRALAEFVQPLRDLWNCASFVQADAACRTREPFLRGVGVTAGEITGTVQVRRGGKLETVKTGQVLLPGDEVRTGADSRASFTLSDGARLEIGASSSFVLEADDPSRGSLKSGVLRLKATIKSLYNRRYAVRTTLVVLAVRGSDAVIAQKEGETILLVGEGQVEVPAAPGAPAVTIEAGQRAVFREGAEKPVIEPIQDYPAEAAKLIGEL